MKFVTGKERTRRERSGTCGNATKGAVKEKTSVLIVEKDYQKCAEQEQSDPE